jgi:CRP-like cAMP-binding protein
MDLKIYCMYEKLKTYCQSIVSFKEEELALIDLYFEKVTLGKKAYLLTANEICDFVGFIAEGTIRHFHIREGEEKTCDISFENAWVTDFQSFNRQTPCIMNLQALAPTTIMLIRRDRLLQLYQACGKFETFGRHMAEHVAQHATEIAMSLSSEKPEQRFQNLLKNQPDIFRRAPQKYIANFLGISPESLSRIRSRVYHKGMKFQ